MKNIAVIGVGYVGLVTGTCLADLGHRVVCLDVNVERVENLKKCILPIYEPGLEEVVCRNMNAGRLTFTTSYADAINGQTSESAAEYVFIAVGTPSAVDGKADLDYVRQAAESVAQVMDHPLIIVNKSTVPVGTGDWTADIIKARQTRPIKFNVVSNPEFLREGNAIYDFMQPDRVVLGSLEHEAAEKVAQLYLPLRATIMITDLRTAEMIKYASNAFLATKISFINEIANICEALGADVKEVATGMGFDQRIGRAFLDAGVGYGGSCFPKDVLALAHMAKERGRHPQLIQAVMDINADRRKQVVDKLRELLGGELHGKKIGVLGLAFKPNTDDMRDAPATEVIGLIEAEGGQAQAYDPVAMNVAKLVMPGLTLTANPYECAAGCDAVVLMTEWNEFKQLDLRRLKNVMNSPVMVDARNVYEPKLMADMGFSYRGIGRGQNNHS
jgi:UDPglucose 6-dehydrogenase